MNIYTIKLSKKKALAIIALLVIVVAVILLAVPDKDSYQPTEPTAKTASVKTQQGQIDYITALGYEVEFSQSRQVTIPKTFDAVYEKYNELQVNCGFDLSDYKGKAATLSTFRVTNYPDTAEVLLDLIICKSKVIGGAVYTVAIDGFMHGLTECPIA